METRKKRIIIITCADCRLRMRVQEGGYTYIKKDFCGGAQRYIDKCMPIPEWCPLEDAEDKEDGDV